MQLTLVTSPAAEPLTLEEGQLHLRVDGDDSTEDVLITALIKAAREWCEGFQGRSYITQTWKLTLDAFPASDAVIVLPYPPIQSITSIKYIDTDGAEQTMSSDDYSLNTAAEPGEIELAYDASWPSIRSQRAAVEVTYVAGYGLTSSTVPELFRHAIRLRLGDFYEHRETEIVGTISKTLQSVAAERLLITDRVIVVEE